MSKMIGGIAFLWVILTLFAGFMQGGGGLNSTILTTNMATTDTSCEVQNTAGFLNADILTIGGEKMNYSSKDLTHFYGLTRDNPVVHLAVNSDHSPTMVYNQQTSILNSALGFSPGSVASSAGAFSLVIVPYNFFNYTFINMIRGGSLVPFLPAELQWIGYLWVAVTIGIVISLCVALVWVFANLIGRVF